MKLSILSQNSNKSNMDEMNKTEKYWQELKSKNYNDSFPIVKNWLENHSASLNSMTQNFKLNGKRSMKDIFNFNKFKLVYAFLLLAVVFAACNMPVTQNETIAYGIKWKTAKSTEAVEKINSLNWIDKSQLSVQELKSGEQSTLEYNAIFNASSEKELNTYLRELDNVPGLITANLYQLNQETKRPLYAAALHSIFRIDIDATSMNDELATAEIQKQLKDAGVTNVQVSFKKNANGERMLEMSPIGNEDMKNDFELSVKDGNNEQFIKTRKGSTTLDLEGKSDDEIRKTVAEDIKKNGMDVNPDDIKIIHEDGKLKIELTKTEDSKDKKMQSKIELKLK